jgi:hypothetical protein
MDQPKPGTDQLRDFRKLLVFRVGPGKPGILKPNVCSQDCDRADLVHQNHFGLTWTQFRLSWKTLVLERGLTRITRIITFFFGESDDSASQIATTPNRPAKPECERHKGMTNSNAQRRPEERSHS